jgi:hypothetical protein
MTQAYNLSQLANNLNTTGQLDATDGLVNAIPVANGGTGASSASGARTNLDVPSTSGSGASGTWGINITGNAATATSATSATTATSATNATFATTAGNGGVTSVNTATGAVNLASLAAFNRSLTASGYQYLPGGLLIQWGFSVDPNSVTYPITFPNAVLCAQCCRSVNDTVARVTAMNQVTNSTALPLFGFPGDTGYWLVVGY